MSEPTEAPSKNMPIAVKDAIPLYNAYLRVTAQLHEFCYENGTACGNRADPPPKIRPNFTSKPLFTMIWHQSAASINCVAPLPFSVSS